MQIRGIDKIRERFFPTDESHEGTILEDTPLYFEEDSKKVKPASSKKKGWKQLKGGKVGRQNAIIDYLKTREGKVTSNQDIAEATGLTDGYTSTLMAELLAKKTVSRRGKRGSYKFIVNHTRVNRKRKSQPKKTVKVNKTVKVEPVTEKPAEQSVSSPSIEKVYNYIARNEDRMMSQEEIARGAGVSTGTVGRGILQLLRDKRIVRSDPLPRQGTRYWLYEHIETGIPEMPNDSEEVPAGRIEAVTDTSHLVYLIDGLAWEFIKETGSISVVDFIGWLNEKNK